MVCIKHELHIQSMFHFLLATLSLFIHVLCSFFFFIAPPFDPHATHNSLLHCNKTAGWHLNRRITFISVP